MGQELTLNLIATFVREDDGIFTWLFRISSRISHVTLHRSEFRSPTCKVIRIVDILRTSRVRAEELSHRAIGYAILYLFRISGNSIVDIGFDFLAIPVQPSDGELLLFPMMSIGVGIRIIPIIIGIIIRMDTMVEVILLLYFPPLTFVFHKDEETSCTRQVAIGMIVITNHLSVHYGSGNGYIFSRFSIEDAKIILHEAFILFCHFHGCPAIVHITIRLASRTSFRSHKRTVTVLQHSRSTQLISEHRDIGIRIQYGAIIDRVIVNTIRRIVIMVVVYQYRITETCQML